MHIMITTYTLVTSLDEDFPALVGCHTEHQSHLHASTLTVLRMEQFEALLLN